MQGCSHISLCLFMFETFGVKKSCVFFCFAKIKKSQKRTKKQTIKHTIKNYSAFLPYLSLNPSKYKHGWKWMRQQSEWPILNTCIDFIVAKSFVSNENKNSHTQKKKRESFCVCSGFVLFCFSVFDVIYATNIARWAIVDDPCCMIYDLSSQRYQGSSSREKSMF